MVWCIASPDAAVNGTHVAPALMIFSNMSVLPTERAYAGELVDVAISATNRVAPHFADIDGIHSPQVSTPS
jgi:hypothetical protein